ncbi:MAG: flagellar basal body-associated FliL family protein [Rhodospirillaceae bacterium]|nr:flagellar basal body-associated FliL family protein [Rhodospirillaceae bacterium]
MADDDLADEIDDEDADDLEDGEEGEEGEDGPKSGRKRLLIVIAAVLVLLLGGATAAFFLGYLQPVIDMITGQEETALDEEAQALISGEAVFYDLPEMLVNINTTGRKSTYLKIRVSLELEKAEDIVRVEGVMPRIIDNFQVYLRELRIEDLQGSAGMYRLREELLKRVNVAVSPAQVNDVLFKEMLVQ